MSFIEVQVKSEELKTAKGIRTGTRVYDVTSDDVDDDVHGAETADDGTTAIPSIGDAWDGTLTTCLVIGRSVKHGGDDDPLYYEVTIEYSSEQTGQEIENPLSRPTQYSYDDNIVQEPYFRDTDDLPVTNSAGDDFAALPSRGASEGVIVVTRNVSSFNDLTAESYRNTINSANKTINGVTYTARTLLIAGWSATGPHLENGVTFWTETIRIAKRAATWDDKFEDRGLNELSSGKPKPILDAKNQPITAPYPLNGSGAKRVNVTDAPAVITRKPYAAGSFPTL